MNTIMLFFQIMHMDFFLLIWKATHPQHIFCLKFRPYLFSLMIH